MKKSSKNVSKKEEVLIADLIEDWNKNSEIFKTMSNINFNEYLIYCANKYTILPR